MPARAPEGIPGPDPGPATPDMFDDLTQAPIGVTVAAAAYALAVVATLAEVGWTICTAPHRRRRTLSEAVTAGVMLAGSLAVGIVYTALFVALWSLVGAHHPAAAPTFWAAHPLAGALTAFLLWDLGFWLYHAIGHATKVGWAAHAPHHSGRSYNLTIGLRQPWFPFHGLLVWPWIALTGLPFDLVVAVGAVTTVWQLLVHTSAPIRPPARFAAVFVTPGAHRRHHEHGAAPVNLGGVLTIWDRLAGTWAGPAEPTPSPVDQGPATTENPLVLELRPWIDLRRHGRTDDSAAAPTGAATTATAARRG